MKKILLILGILIAANVSLAAPRPHAEFSHTFPLQLTNKLVFTRGRPAVHFMVPGTEVVWTMNPDGSDQKPVWRVPKGYGRFGDFNSKGTRALSYNKFDVYLHDLKSHHIQHLFVHSSGWGTFVKSVSFSWDGKRVVFAAGGGGGGALSSNVYVIDIPQSQQDIDKREHSRVPPPPDANGVLPNDMFEPRFNPDGKRIAVSIGYRTESETFAGSWNIWTLDIDGSSPVQVTANPTASVSLNAFDIMPCFSPNGRTIAFVRRTFNKGRESNDIWIVNHQHQKRLTSYEKAAKHDDTKTSKREPYNRISNLRFSSDGKRIAFNQTGHENGIYCVGIDGNNLKRLTDGMFVQWVW